MSQAPPRKAPLHLKCKRLRLKDLEQECIICGEPVKRSFTAGKNGTRAHGACWSETGLTRKCAYAPCSTQFQARNYRNIYCSQYHAQLVAMVRNGPECSLCGEQMFYSRHSAEFPAHAACTGATPRRKRGSNGPSWANLRASVIGRDGGVCQICGIGIPASAKYPHPMSPAVDHIVPVSATGIADNRMENLRLTHSWCNSTRKDAALTDAEVADRSHRKWSKQAELY